MKSLLIFFISSLIYLPAIAQEISYSEPKRIDVRSIHDFEIIGKLNANFLIYKTIKNKRFIDIYDSQMKLKKRVHLAFIHDNFISMNSIAYQDFTYIIYQFQKRKIVYCMAAALDDNGKLIKNPFELDTTHVSFWADRRIYNITYSEDKSKIMIYKIHRENVVFNFTTMLFNDSFKLIHKSVIETPFKAENNIFSDFSVDDSGNFIFTKGDHFGTTDYLYHLTLVTKSPVQDNLTMNDVDLFGLLLDEINLKIDNVNKQYLINSLFYTKRNGNIEGLYTAMWNENFDTFTLQYATLFNGCLENTAKSKEISKTVFNTFVIRDVFFKNDEGFILTLENARRAHNDSWLPNNQFFSSFPYLFSSRTSGRVYESAIYNNIVVLNFNDTLKLAASFVIHKSQFNNGGNNNYLSYFMMNTGTAIHFLFDEQVRHRWVTYDQIIKQNGNLSDKALLRSLNLKYQLMPSFATQVSSYEIIIPCTFRNYICFTKITY